MMGEWDRQGVVNSDQGVGGRTGGGYHLIGFFICAFVFLSVMSSLF